MKYYNSIGKNIQDAANNAFNNLIDLDAIRNLQNVNWNDVINGGGNQPVTPAPVVPPNIATPTPGLPNNGGVVPVTPNQPPPPPKDPVVVQPQIPTVTTPSTPDVALPGLVDNNGNVYNPPTTNLPGYTGPVTAPTQPGGSLVNSSGTAAEAMSDALRQQALDKSRAELNRLTGSGRFNMDISKYRQPWMEAMQKSEGFKPSYFGKQPEFKASSSGWGSSGNNNGGVTF